MRLAGRGGEVVWGEGVNLVGYRIDSGGANGGGLKIVGREMRRFRDWGREGERERAAEGKFGKKMRL